MSAVALNASSASRSLPPRWLAVPSSRYTSARSAGLSIRSSSAVRKRAAASSKASASVAARAASRLYSMPRAGSAERRGGGEVVREVGEVAPRAPVGALEGLADAQVELRPAHAREPVVERPAHELVREAVGQRARRELLDHPAANGLVEHGEQLGLGEAGGAADDVERELGSGGGGELQEVGGARRQAGEPLADDLAHALGGAELGQRRA